MESLKDQFQARMRDVARHVSSETLKTGASLATDPTYVALIQAELLSLGQRRLDAFRSVVRNAGLGDQWWRGINQRQISVLDGLVSTNLTESQLRNAIAGWQADGHGKNKQRRAIRNMVQNLPKDMEFRHFWETYLRRRDSAGTADDISSGIKLAQKSVGGFATKLAGALGASGNMAKMAGTLTGMLVGALGAGASEAKLRAISDILTAGLPVAETYGRKAALSVSQPPPGGQPSAQAPASSSAAPGANAPLLWIAGAGLVAYLLFSKR